MGYLVFSFAVDIYYLGKLSNGTEKTLKRGDYAMALIINLGMLIAAVFA